MSEIFETNLERINFFFEKIYTQLELLIKGMLIGIACIIPGLSGGTIALIAGIYEQLIENIKTISQISILKRKKQELLSSLRFLTTLGLGIITSIIAFSHILHYLITHEIYNIYLYSLFCGLIIASALICIKQTKINFANITLITIGVILALLITNNSEINTINEKTPYLIDWQIMCCGVIIAIALMLPGISGSYLLNIFGMYSTTIIAINKLTSGIMTITFDKNSFFILLNLSVGILIGLIITSRTLSWLLKHYKVRTMSLLIGFMLGSLKAIWPLNYYNNINESTKSYHMSVALLFCILGFITILLMQKILKNKKTNLGLK